jgi:hypothetical protein
MSTGKARFWVKKFTDFQRSVFEVKTPTAICGVRGSDFIAMVTADRTELTALEKTFLEVLSRAFPEQEPLTITSFERAIVETTAMWKEEITPEEIEQLKQLFTVIVEMLEAEEEKKPPEEPPEEPPRRDSEDELVAPDPEELEEPKEPPAEDIFEQEEPSREEEDIVEREEETRQDEFEAITREEQVLPEFPLLPE